MKVDGKKFKEARILIKNDPVRIKKFEMESGSVKSNDNLRLPKIGTQQWLADVSGVDIRSIQSLEAGSAGQPTVDAVSHHLGINGNHYIYGYGEKHIKCGANKYIDFRPEICPDLTGGYINSNVMLTIDPLSLSFLDDDLVSVTLHEIKASIDVLGCDFTWWSFVNINPRSDWLGQVEETNQVTIKDHDIKFWPIMFKQESLPYLSWVSFVERIEKMDVDFFSIKVRLIFSHFEKCFDIHIDSKEMAAKFKLARAKYKSEHPYRIQTRPLVMT